jgi:hypothetical protein
LSSYFLSSAKQVGIPGKQTPPLAVLDPIDIGNRLQAWVNTMPVGLMNPTGLSWAKLCTFGFLLLVNA